MAVALLTGGKLQARDMALLNLVWRLGIVSASQIRRALFFTVKNPIHARNAANRRLRFLYEQHCLDRLTPGYRAEAVYFLDIQGARLIRMQQNAPSLRDIHWSASDNGKQILFLKHRLGISETVVSLMEAGRTHGFSVDWMGETHLQLSTADGYGFIPDGLGILTRPGNRRLPFFLEWDEAGETIRRITRKVAYYAHYARRIPAWRSDFSRMFPDYAPPPKFPPLIFVTTGGKKRLRHMLAAADTVRQRTIDKRLSFPILMANGDMAQQAGIWGAAFFTPEAVTNGDFEWGHTRSIAAILGLKGEQ